MTKTKCLSQREVENLFSSYDDNNDDDDGYDDDDDDDDNDDNHDNDDHDDNDGEDDDQIESDEKKSFNTQGQQILAKFFNNLFDFVPSGRAGVPAINTTSDLS